ncbi:MAG TPA: ATP-binding protein, partial [Longimicrobium sp.]
VNLPGRRIEAAPASPRVVHAEELVVGKDIVELLSTAMYVEPLALYREYVQNAADAIDQACRAGLLSGRAAGRIDVSLDASGREVRIRDNGIGLPASDAERMLIAFGASRKRGDVESGARGFRGVGRLAALGYAQALSFRTKAHGELRGTEVRWDCRKLRSILLDPEYLGDLRDVVRDVVTVREGPKEELDSHYFEVHLERVVRLRNDLLLNEDEIRCYLAQVAPVPFPRTFRFATAIEEYLSDFLPGGHFEIRIGNSEARVERPFSDEFAISTGKTDRFTELETITLEDPDIGLVAVGWVLHHGYHGAIHASPGLRGLRARVGDLQVGGPEIFAGIFPESRFNAWTVGELHIIDPRVVPNGRRDNFEQNAAALTLIHRLGPLGRGLAHKCRDSSARRVRLKKFEANERKAIESLEILEDGKIGRAAADLIGKEIGSALGQMQMLIEHDLLLRSEQEELRDRLETLRVRYDVVLRAPVGSALKDVSKKQRAVYEQAVHWIFECSPNRAAAKALVDRIAARIQAGGDGDSA